MIWSSETVAAVDVPVDVAFHIFTGLMRAWWPTGLRAGIRPAADIVVEPQDGGRWFERGIDASETDRGRIRYWEPPHRLVFTMQVDSRWRFDPCVERVSQVDARFTADGPVRTIVRVVGRRSSTCDDGIDLAAAVELWGGWPALLDHYTTLATSGKPQAHGRRSPLG